MLLYPSRYGTGDTTKPGGSFLGRGSCSVSPVNKQIRWRSDFASKATFVLISQISDCANPGWVLEALGRMRLCW